MKVKVSTSGTAFALCLLYVLMRPFLTNYITPLYKYLFILLLLVGLGVALVHKSTIMKIGSLEMTLCLAFYIYALLNAAFLGGQELLGYTFERYIFYTVPLFVFAYFGNKINWDRVFAFLMWFGIIDSAISLIEFITKKQMFPMSNGESNVEMITMAGTKILRTYGLQGNYFLLAEILCVCGLASLWLYEKKNQKVYFYSFLFISVGILSTGSRGYYVSYGGAMVFMYLYIRKRRGLNVNTLIKTLVFFVTILILLYILFFTNVITGIGFVDSILSRIRMIIDWTGDSSNSARIEHWINALKRWKENPLFGNGACCTDTRYSKYVAVTESGILKRLVELGIFGTALQYLTMFVPLRQSIIKKRKGTLTEDAPCLYGILVCFFIEDIVLQRYTALEYTIISWTALSLLAYTNKRESKHEESL